MKSLWRLLNIKQKTMNPEEMTIEEKRAALYDWISHLDESALDDLINDFLVD